MNAASDWAPIASPGYPGAYFDNADCFWVIQSTTEVELKVIDMDLETNYDFLRLYDGDSVDSPPIVTLTGNIQIQPTYFSTGSNLYMKFTSDGGTAGQGFQVQYRVAADKGLCDSDPCKNGGACYLVGNTYRCNCLIGTGGSNCEGKVNKTRL